MRTFPASLQAHLDTGATTLCWCWRITRADGVRLGFTDHDRDLAFDATLFEAASGFTASEAREAVGLGVDNQEVEGALSSERLSAEDLEAGRYDNAEIEVFRVDWNAPESRALLHAGTLGEVRRGPVSFAAEIRGLAHLLQQDQGRTYQYACDADLGDHRCKIDLDQATLKASATVAAGATERRFTASGLGAFATDWFTRGRILWSSGGNTGLESEVKLHIVSGGLVSIELWLRPSRPIAPGDTFTITAGCDKHLVTCRQKFGNVVNYRGFPSMPGNDFISTYPNRGDSNDGSPIG